MQRMCGTFTAVGSRPFFVATLCQRVEMCTRKGKSCTWARCGTRIPFLSAVPARGPARAQV